MGVETPEIRESTPEMRALRVRVDIANKVYRAACDEAYEALLSERKAYWLEYYTAKGRAK